MFERLEKWYFLYWERKRIRNNTATALFLVTILCGGRGWYLARPVSWYDQVIAGVGFLAVIFLAIGIIWRFERVDPAQTVPDNLGQLQSPPRPAIAAGYVEAVTGQSAINMAWARDAAALGPPRNREIF